MFKHKFLKYILFIILSFISFFWFLAGSIEKYEYILFMKKIRDEGGGNHEQLNMGVIFSLVSFALFSCVLLLWSVIKLNLLMKKLENDSR